MSGKGQLCFMVPDVCCSRWREVCAFRAMLTHDHAVYLTRCPLGKAASGGIVAVMRYSL